MPGKSNFGHRSPFPLQAGGRITPLGAQSGSGSSGGSSELCPRALIPCCAQKLDCSRVTRRGQAPSSGDRAVPESHVGSQEAGPEPRPLPRRENPVQRELATGDLGGEVTGGVGSDVGGGAGGTGSPPESTFPPGEWRTLGGGIPGPHPLRSPAQHFPHQDKGIPSCPDIPPRQDL